MTRKSRRIADLTEALTGARTERDMYRLRSGRYAVRIERLVRALATCRRDRDAARRELAAQKRVNDRLANQLFNAMGYTDAGLKALGVPTAAAAGQEPGEVT